MYKLFLCLQYLLRRYLAILAVLAVALCTFMVLVTVSVFDGFLRKAELAAKGLFGEIIVEAPSLSAIGRYDEFIGRLTGRYRLEGQYNLVEFKADGGGAKAVFQSPARYSQAEELAGKDALKAGLTAPAARPAVGLVFHKGRLLSRAEGVVSVLPAPPVEGEAPTYLLQFTVQLPAPPESFDKDNPPALEALYARFGQGLPEIQAASPVLYSQGLLRIGHAFTAPVQVCGIRLPERLEVTDFASGLFAQCRWRQASFDPPLSGMAECTRDHLALIQQVEARTRNEPAHEDVDALPQLKIAAENVKDTLERLAMAEELHRQVMIDQQELNKLLAQPEERQDRNRIALLRARLDKFGRDDLIRPAGSHLILGLGIPGLSFRTKKGEYIRYVTPGRSAVLALLPVAEGRGSLTMTPEIRTFTVVDDVKTDVYNIDSQTVYVPFSTLQMMLHLGEEGDIADLSNYGPARCSQINIKVAAGFDSGRRLVQVRQKIRQAWNEFAADYPDAIERDSPVQILTWRERLAKFINVIEKQRTLVTMMFGIISMVSVLLVFAIFYMIVEQKTRDIGIVRAVGGSSAGVAQIFLTYGACTGLVGSLLGLLAGWAVTHYINEIQDWVDKVLGFRVWDMDTFLFEKIPNQVDWSVAMVIAAWAVVSGLVGALIPSVRAAVMQPAEAIRYE